MHACSSQIAANCPSQPIPAGKSDRVFRGALKRLGHSGRRVEGYGFEITKQDTVVDIKLVEISSNVFDDSLDADRVACTA